MFSKRLIDLINDKAVSRYKIALDTKITEATLSNYCKGKVKPSPSIVKLLSEYFQVDYNWLLAGEKSATQPALNLASDNEESEYRMLSKRATKTNINQMMAFYERQINEKDRQINELLLTIDTKLNLLLSEL